MSDGGPASQRPGRPPGRVQRCPFLVTCPPGLYRLCRCQRSAQYPYCDGSHRDTAGGGDPDAAPSRTGPLEVVLDTTRTVAWCACGRSARAPFCDGSHADD